MQMTQSNQRYCKEKLIADRVFHWSLLWIEVINSAVGNQQANDQAPEVTQKRYSRWVMTAWESYTGSSLLRLAALSKLDCGHHHPAAKAILELLVILG